MTNNLSSNHWSHMRLIRAYWEPIMRPKPDGTLYVADPHGAKMLEVQCDCGHKWTMLKEDFPGRRKLKSCGRVECPHSMPKSKRGHKTGVNFTTYFTADNHEFLLAKAKAGSTTKSKIVNQALDRMRADDLLRD